MHYQKDLTKNLAITTGPECDQLIIPVSQHIGAPCEVIVAVGDQVMMGQKIAESKSFVSAPIHASVSGKVTAIAPYPHPIGKAVLSIVIENDKLYTPAENIKPAKPLAELSSAEIVDLIKDAGLVGLGGATFPTHVKLTPPKEKPVDTLILNGAECEPYLSADHRVMLEYTGDIIMGIRIMAKALAIKSVFIGIEDNKLDAINMLKKEITGQQLDGRIGSVNHNLIIKVVSLKTKYPQGAEKILVKSILKRKVPAKGIPLDVGVVVSNVGTVAQIAQSFKTGMPLIERVVTVVGDGIDQPGNYLVKIGTPFKAFFSKPDAAAKVVMGGPMMGFAQWTLDVPVIKGTSGILSLPKSDEEEQPCIRCARCVQACPIGLMPLFDADDSCMECGCCAYVCPAKRHLVQRIKLGKLERKNQKAGTK